MNRLRISAKSKLQPSINFGGFVCALLASHLVVANETGSKTSAAGSIGAPPSATQAISEIAPGLIAFDAEAKELVIKEGSTTADFVFSYKNVSAGAVIIEKIVTSCGCTTASVMCPLTVETGESGSIPVTLIVAGRQGIIRKTVAIETNRGTKVLSIQATIPQAFGASDVQSSEQLVVDGALPVQKREPDNHSLSDMRAMRAMRITAARDRQSVFKGECATCHVTPAVGKFGKELYATACAICHEAKNHATMVKNLRTLPHSNHPEFWRKSINIGVPNSFMPAFSEIEGGPLSSEQVESLVKFMMGEFDDPEH